jgi:DNA gyrase/topoisomerase IV subunit A
VLLRRMHILEGFVLIFDALDEIIKIIRASDGKADAAEKIMKRFPAAKGRTGRRADRRHLGIETVSTGKTGNQFDPRRVA